MKQYFKIRITKETLTKFTQDDNIMVYQIVDNQTEIRYQ